MKIHFIIPWDDYGNLGKAYNQAMKKVGLNDWVCFLDMDAMHSTHFAPLYIKGIINEHKEDGFGLYSCMTNRIGNQEQIAPGSKWDDDTLSYNRALGDVIFNKYYRKVKLATKPISGVLLLTSKKAWRAAGGFSEDLKLLGVDNDYHKRIEAAGYNVGIMQGIYVIHYYRNGKQSNKSHLLNRKAIT